MTDDLIAWLRAQLDEDEREILRHGPPMPPAFGVTPSRFTTMQAGTTVLMNPRRVLAEVDAKRRILDVYRAEVIDVSRVPSRPEWVHGRVPVEAHTVLRLLALPYADRPGYRDEWRP